MQTVRTPAPEPADPSAIDPGLLRRLVKYPHLYDWDAVAELWPTEDTALRFVRAVDRAVNPNVRHRDKYETYASRTFRRDLTWASELAGELNVTYAQRNKFARLFATIVSTDDDYDTNEIHDAWRRTLDQKVTLAYLRESTENIACATLSHYQSVLDGHKAGMTAAYAREAARGQLGMFTIRQLVALSKTDIDPAYASGVCHYHRQRVSDIKALVAARVPWNYMTPLLSRAMPGETIARYWDENIPLEYATAA